MMAYADRVVSGADVAGKFERLACERLMRDLDRQNTDAFPYVLDHDAGRRACVFFELLPHIKGEWARPNYVNGEPRYATIKLEGWQLFAEYQLFGWRHRDTGLRRYRRSYEEVARKNAKSTRAAARLLYLLTADEEPGAHCYSAATTGEQAREVFDVARNMVLRLPDFQARFGVTPARHDLTVVETASTLKPLNAEGSTLDGLNIHGAVVDEVHAHKTRAVWDVIDTADGARSQPMISAITTAGSDRSGICYELRDYSLKVLQGVIADETWFAVIYTIDEGDVWHDKAVWRKANPNLGISVKVDNLESKCLKAKAQPSALPNFLTKHLNVWVNSGSQWIDMLAWNKCADPSLRLEDFAEDEMFIGLDLAEKSDFAAKVYVCRRLDTYYLITRFYLNEVAVEQSGNAHLQGWAAQGYIEVNEGNVTDFDAIAEDLHGDAAMLNVSEVPYDPALTRYFATKLADAGLPMVEVRQAPVFFTQPMNELEALVLSGRLVHDGNPVMAWMVSNVVVRESKFTRLKHPTKERKENKIDGPVAAFLGLGRAMQGVPSSPMVY